MVPLTPGATRTRGARRRRARPQRGRPAAPTAARRATKNRRAAPRPSGTRRCHHMSSRERELLIELFEDFSLRNGRFVSPVSGDLQGMPVKLPRTVNDERRKTA